MNFKEYQQKAVSTAIYPRKHKIIYPALGLGDEAGEVLGKIKKWLRGDDGKEALTKERKLAIADEMGDVLWYLAVLSNDLKIPLEEIANNNLKKLKSRKDRGVIRGSGDKR
ncbi:MAG: nucleoside triphosphate pyrophosphohydrolase family protein [Clostridia bacterium]|nr:nucleoside triphosphate pyrophosphohydrolase family protein [Clostridia bacterium]